MEAPRRFVQSVAFASFLGAALVGGAVVVVATPVDARADIDESYFYVSLSSHGNWVENASFGWVWYPYHRPVGWRPYTYGQWVWTDYGEWMWASDEPYGWATYHYGRWFLDPFYGWVWIPGRVWAPAWVSWRYSDDYIGWSPLGPWGYYDYHHRRYRHWDRWDHHGRRDHHGRHDGRHDRYDDDWRRRYSDNRDDNDHWNFTRKRDFANTRIDRVRLDRNKASDVIRRSREVAPPSEQEEREGRGITRGISKDMIERAAGRPIRAVKVEDAPEPPKGGAGGSLGRATRSDARGGDKLRVFRPKVTEAKPDRTPDRLGIAKPDAKRVRPSDDARGGGRRPADGGEIRGGQRDGRDAREPQRSRDGQGAQGAQGAKGARDAERGGKPDGGPDERRLWPGGSKGGGGADRDDSKRDAQPSRGSRGEPRVNEPQRAPRGEPRVDEPQRAPRNEPRVNEQQRSPRVQEQRAPRSEPRAQEQRVQEQRAPRSAPRVQQPQRAPRSEPRVQQPQRAPRSEPRVQQPQRVPARAPSAPSPSRVPSVEPRGSISGPTGGGSIGDRPTGGGSMGGRPMGGGSTGGSPGRGGDGGHGSSPYGGRGGR